jgi:hypothetical protein
MRAFHVFQKIKLAILRVRLSPLFFTVYIRASSRSSKADCSETWRTSVIWTCARIDRIRDFVAHLASRHLHNSGHVLGAS